MSKPTKENTLLDRQEFQALISRAKIASNSVLNPEWKLAYNNLILALSTLDAFIARSTVI